MAVFRCKMCGGDLDIQSGETVVTCEYCGTAQTLPRLDDDRRINLYDRANHFRRNNEYDKAAGIYERILEEDGTDAEAYWSLVLCRYGIEYVEDPQTHKRVPTVNRAQFTSVFADENYKAALEHADAFQRKIYEAEAKAIDEIQKGILEISAREEPFDVFICYKETDVNGRRTIDSVLATDLYHQLTQEGFKVFFSRITLEDKLGTAYEPYIFAALNSAKVMVVLGTKPEHFNAVWVKNEWSRYLSLVKQSDGKKILIPAYRDMDPYDLPEEFSHLQAQDMSKLGFMQDLIRGIKKILTYEQPEETSPKTSVISAKDNMASMLKRAFILLEDKEWDKADQYFEQVLAQDPENAQAYLGKLLVALKIQKPEDLGKYKESLSNITAFKRCLKYADDALKEKLILDEKTICDRIALEENEEKYAKASAILKSAKTEQDYLNAAALFAEIPNHRDSQKQITKCNKLAQNSSGKRQKFREQYAPLQKMIAIYNTDSLILGVRSNGTVLLYDSSNKIYHDVDWTGIIAVGMGCSRLIGLRFDGTVLEKKYSRRIGYGSDPDQFVFGDTHEIENWKDIIDIAVGDSLYFEHVLGLKKDGTIEVVPNVLEYNDKYLKEEEQAANKALDEIRHWNNISSIESLRAIKKDGTILVDKVDRLKGIIKTAEKTKNILQIESGETNVLVSLQTNGKVVLYEDFELDDEDEDDYCSGDSTKLKWSNIAYIAAGWEYIYGLKADGSLECFCTCESSRDTKFEELIKKWDNITMIKAYAYAICAIKSDGTVLFAQHTTTSQKSTNALTISGMKLFNSVDEIPLEREKMRVRFKEEQEKKRIKIEEEREKKRKQMQQQLSNLLAQKEELTVQLNNVKGLFAASRRNKIEAQISQLDEEIAALRSNDLLQ